MALIKCPECEKEISSDSSVCVHCGYPIASLKSDYKYPLKSNQYLKPKKKIKYIISITVLLSFCIALVVFLSIAKCNHEWSSATCSAPEICRLCNAERGEINPSAHKWSGATMSESSKCLICGEEDLFGWPISTSKIMGTWEALCYYSDGEFVSGTVSKLEARFVTDGTGYIKQAGDKYIINWSFDKEDDDMLLYKVKMDGDTRALGYITDPTSDYYGKLMLCLDSNFYVILMKVA